MGEVLIKNSISWLCLGDINLSYVFDFCFFRLNSSFKDCPVYDCFCFTNSSCVLVAII